MNTKFRIEAKTSFEKDFFNLMNNTVLGKTVENVRKHKDIKFETKERRRNYSISEPSYNITKVFTEYLLAIEIKITQVLMNKHVYLEN